MKRAYILYKEVIVIIPLIVIIGLVVLGILFCFWGYKYLKGIMLVFAFLGGVMFTYNFLADFAPNLGSTAWIIALAVGVILAVLVFFFIRFAIFLVGGVMGLLLFNLLRDMNPALFSGMETVLAFLIGLAFFVGLGALTLAASKHMVIIFSAIFGAYAMTSAFGVLLGLVIQPSALAAAQLPNVLQSLSGYSVFAGAPAWAFYAPIIVLSIMGVIAQYRFTARGKKW